MAAAAFASRLNERPARRGGNTPPHETEASNLRFHRPTQIYQVRLEGDGHPTGEEPCELTIARSNGPDIRSFRTVAHRARVAMVIGVRRAAVLFGDDVIHLASDVRVLLMDQAILANMICSRLDKSA